MAQVTVRVEDFEDGVFPSVCASSGVPVEKFRRSTARYEPGWPLVFCLLGPVGVVIALVAIGALTRTVDGWMPVDPDVVDRVHRVRRVAWTTAIAITGVTVAATALLFSSSAGTAATLVLVLGLAGAGFALYRAANPPGKVKARLAPNGRTITLTRVHPEFVVDYKDQEWRRRAARRDVAAPR